MNHPNQPETNPSPAPLPPAVAQPVSADELERQLRQALRPVAAPPALAGQILAAARPSRLAAPSANALWGRYALAAVLLLSSAMAVRFWQQQQAERQQELARQETARQLTTAFTLASEKILHSQGKAAGKLKLLLKPLENLPQKGL